MEPFRTAIAALRSHYEFPAYLNEICNAIILGPLDKSRIDQILKDYRIDSDKARVDFSHFIIEFLWRAIETDILKERDRLHVVCLLNHFSIKSGDIYPLLDDQVEQLILRQEIRLHKADYITAEGALSKQNLYQLFGFSASQIIEYEERQAQDSEKWGDVRELDIFFMSDEYFKSRGDRDGNFGEN